MIITTLDGQRSRPDAAEMKASSACLGLFAPMLALSLAIRVLDLTGSFHCLVHESYKIRIVG